MLKKFDRDSVASQSQVRSSVQRGIRQSILASYPALAPYLPDILPKKHPLFVVKCHDHVTMVAIDNEPQFFNVNDGQWIPTLRLLHKYPFILPRYQVDKGAIKFVLSGAQIMCPGLTSPGGRMEDVDKGAIVAIMAEGKEHALAIGQTTMSTADIRAKNKGPGVENLHSLLDGLWQLKKLD
eukprot:m51a1_g14036 hypothetical protein (181) ;mRNA; r:1164719-1165881